MTKTKETNSIVANKKVLLPAIVGAVVAVVTLTGIFIAYPAISSVYAVQPSNTTTNTATTGTVSGSSQQLPKITGSIKLQKILSKIMLRYHFHRQLILPENKSLMA